MTYEQRRAYRRSGVFWARAVFFAVLVALGVAALVGASLATGRLSAASVNYLAVCELCGDLQWQLAAMSGVLAAATLVGVAVLSLGYERSLRKFSAAAFTLLVAVHACFAVAVIVSAYELSGGVFDDDLQAKWEDLARLPAQHAPGAATACNLQRHWGCNGWAGVCRNASVALAPPLNFTCPLCGPNRTFAAPAGSNATVAALRTCRHVTEAAIGAFAARMLVFGLLTVVLGVVAVAAVWALGGKEQQIVADGDGMADSFQDANAY
jgi:hypothetical protein